MLQKGTGYKINSPKHFKVENFANTGFSPEKNLNLKEKCWRDQVKLKFNFYASICKNNNCKASL